MRSIQHGLLVTLVAVCLSFGSRASADIDLSLCGTTTVETATDCTGDYNIAAVFYTFSDVVAAEGDSSYPTYSFDSLASVEDYIDMISLGQTSITVDVEKRAGADSTYLWVIQEPSTTAKFAIEDSVQAVLERMLPSGWSAGSDGVWFLGGDLNYQPNNNGRVCNGTGELWAYFSTIGHGGYFPFPEHNFNALLIHEFGHQLGIAHLPDNTNGSGSACGGGEYYGCYGAMSYLLSTSDCPEAVSSTNGFIPYHSFSLGEIGFVDVVTIDSDSTGVELGDIRLYGEVVKIPVPGESNEYFLLSNHQNTWLDDDLLGGKGVLIWHILEGALSSQYICSNSYPHIIDLETHSGKFDDDGSGICMDYPLTANPSAGVDSLDCTNDMLNSAFYPGVVAGGGFKYDFTKSTNPSSNKYSSGANDRRDSQADTSGVYIEDLEAITDPSFSGKHRIRFNVAFR